MGHRFEVNGVSVGITDDPLGDAIVGEFSSVAETGAPPELRVELRPGYVTRPTTGTRIGKDVVVGDEWLYVDRNAPTRTTGIGDAVRRVVGHMGHQLEIRGNPLAADRTTVTVCYDPNLTRSFNRPIRSALRHRGRNDLSRLENLARDLLYDTLEPVLHQAMLRERGGFVHAGSVARNGTATLFSGWGGAGKTSVVDGLVRNGDWEFLSDDLAVVADGAAEPYPKSIPNLPTQTAPDGARSRFRTVESELRERWGLGGGSDECSKTAVAKTVHPGAYYGFPGDYHGTYPVSKVVHLLRVEGGIFEVADESPGTLATRLASILGREFEQYADIADAANAANPDRWPSMGAILDRTRRMYEEALADAEVSVVRVPADATPTELSEFVAEELLSAPVRL